MPYGYQYGYGWQRSGRHQSTLTPAQALSVDSTLYTADSTLITADMTLY